MSKKFIPNGHFDFVTMAENFSRRIAADPGRFEITADDCQQLDEAVRKYRAALNANYGGAKSAVSKCARDQARAEAERIVRRIGGLVRSNLRIDAAAKISVGIRLRAEKAKQLPCPQEPPRLKFVRALHEGGATPVHELEFRPWDFGSLKKPPGAVRLELFVDLIPPDEEIPAHPGANHASRPWYLRSYTKSPIKLIPPMAREQMRVVYWGRWADSMGSVGPFSATAAAWIEGGIHALLPGGTGITLGALSGRQAVPILEDATATPGGPVTREAKYRVALLEVQYQSFERQDVVAPALPAPDSHPARQLEGPSQSETASEAA